jgi:hypothetical protein
MIKRGFGVSVARALPVCGGSFVHARPLSMRDEAHPEIGVAPLAAPEHFQLHLTQGFGPLFSCLLALVVSDHQTLRRFVRDLPEAYQLAFRTRKHQSASQPVNAFTVFNFARTRLARRQHDQLRPHRSRPAASSAVRRPSFALPARRWLTPASASPERRSGFWPIVVCGSKAPATIRPLPVNLLEPKTKLRCS